jgi:hypothetical protein
MRRRMQYGTLNPTPALRRSANGGTTTGMRQPGRRTPLRLRDIVVSSVAFSTVAGEDGANALRLRPRLQ